MLDPFHSGESDNQMSMPVLCKWAREIPLTWIFQAGDKGGTKTSLLSTISTLSICNDNSLVTKIHPISRMAQSRQISQQVVNFSFNPSSSWHHIILLKSAYYHITTLHPPLLVLGWLLYCHLDKSNLYHLIQDSPLFSLPGYCPLLFIIFLYKSSFLQMSLEIF